MMITGLAGRSWVSCSVSWMPSMSGMFTSVRTMSGWSLWASSTPSLPSPAVPTTSMSSSKLRSLRRLSRVDWMSSTMSRRMGFSATAELCHLELRCLCGIDLDGRSVGGAEGHRLQVGALRRRGLGANDGVHEDGEVLPQPAVVEGRLADDRMEIAETIVPDLDAATLDLPDGLGDGERDRPGLGVGHPSPRPDLQRPGQCATGGALRWWGRTW